MLSGLVFKHLQSPCCTRVFWTSNVRSIETWWNIESCRKSRNMKQDWILTWFLQTVSWSFWFWLGYRLATDRSDLWPCRSLPANDTLNMEAYEIDDMSIHVIRIHMSNSYDTSRIIRPLSHGIQAGEARRGPAARLTSLSQRPMRNLWTLHGFK